MYEPLVADALRRREIFNNLETYLEKLKETVLKVDPNAGVYMFGSVAEKKHNYGSDVDLLVVTEKDRLSVLEAIAGEEFAKIFEIHVRKPKEAEWYRLMTSLVRI
jgi:predicted nucleotidyltransferase